MHFPQYMPWTLAYLKLIFGAVLATWSDSLQGTLNRSGVLVGTSPTIVAPGGRDLDDTGKESNGEGGGGKFHLEGLLLILFWKSTGGGRMRLIWEDFQIL